MTEPNLPLAHWTQVCEHAISAQIGSDDSSHTPMEMKVFRATFSPPVVLRLLAGVEQLQKERDDLNTMSHGVIKSLKKVVARQREALEECTATGYACGRLQDFVGVFLGGCGQHVNLEASYRCVDCMASFHRECLRKHFKASTKDQHTAIDATLPQELT